MKKNYFTALSLLLALSFGLAGCWQSDSTPDQDAKNSTNNTGSSSVDDGEASSDQDADSKRDKSGETANKGHSTSKENNSGKPSSQKNQSAKDNKGSSADVPHSSQAAIKALMKNVHVSFRKKAPSKIPMDDDMNLTGKTKSSKCHYEVQLIQTSKPIAINNSEFNQTKAKNKLATVSGTYYASKEKAAKQIKTIQQGPNKPNTDLGHGINAYQEGATGHGYITWKEGRWQFQMDSPTDPHYAAHEDGAAKDEKKNSMEIVNFLEDHRLPAPHKKGFVSISTWKNNPKTVITWQEGKAVYKIKTGRYAIDALKMAISMKSFT